MRGIDQGPGTSLGTLGWFLGVWLVMMAAMMFLSVAPMSRLTAYGVDPDGRRRRATPHAVASDLS
jgi:predicted metal-binding membrane protein